MTIQKSLYTYVRMYICMYVRMYICTYVCMYVRMHVYMYVCTYVYLKVYSDAVLPAGIRTYLGKHWPCMPTSKQQTHMYVYSTYITTHTHTHTNTHTHTHTHTANAVHNSTKNGGLWHYFPTPSILRSIFIELMELSALLLKLCV